MIHLTLTLHKKHVQTVLQKLILKQPVKKHLLVHSFTLMKLVSLVQQLILLIQTERQIIIHNVPVKLVIIGMLHNRYVLPV